MSICATAECDKLAVGKSKYCTIHRKIARQKWLENINKQKTDRENRYSQFEKIVKEAELAGQEAGEGHKPIPMVVQEHDNMLDDTSPVAQSWNVPDGVCGFAWVNVRPGNTSFCRWLKKAGLADKYYYGGMCIWVRGFGQSYERKLAYAGAYADVITKYKDDLKVSAYVGSRLD